jgi:sec-independent protein translocase protein TatA
MAGIGLPELAIVLVILLVIFGPKRLPGLGRSLGSGMREFKDSITGKSGDDDEDDDARPALTRAEAAAPAPDRAATAREMGLEDEARPVEDGVASERRS